MEEYTTTKMATFFTILTNKARGASSPWTPLIGRVLNWGSQLRLNYLPERKDKVVVQLMNAKRKSTQNFFFFFFSAKNRLGTERVKRKGIEMYM